MRSARSWSPVTNAKLLSCAAMPVRAKRARLSVLGGETVIENEILQALFAGRGRKYHIPAVAAVSSVGSAFRDERFSPETAAAVAAVAGLDGDLRLVYEHDIPPLSFSFRQKKPGI